MSMNTPRDPRKPQVGPARRRRLTDYNGTYLISDPAITTCDLDALHTRALPPNREWQALRVHSSRNGGDFVVISWRGDLTRYEADLIISPSRMGYLIFAHDAVRFEESESYCYSYCQTIEDVCKVVKDYIGDDMSSNAIRH
jgi:hypothetical protein